MIIPALGTICYYSFATRFAALNGVYKLEKLTAYETAVDESADFVKNLYERVGLGESDYAGDWQGYLGQPVLQLIRQRDKALADANDSATPGQLVLAPAAILALVPDPTVKQYDDVFLNIGIGPYADEQEISHLLPIVADYTAKVTGSTETAVFLSAGELWLTDSQYGEAINQRQAQIQQIQPLSATVLALEAEVERQRTYIAELERTLLALNPPG